MKWIKPWHIFLVHPVITLKLIEENEWNFGYMPRNYHNFCRSAWLLNTTIQFVKPSVRPYTIVRWCSGWHDSSLIYQSLEKMKNLIQVSNISNISRVDSVVEFECYWFSSWFSWELCKRAEWNEVVYKATVARTILNLIIAWTIFHWVILFHLNVLHELIRL